ncbi:BTB/POZ domain-containing protein 3-like isoform X3 [Nilaparvata lugens]|nr:BTB/POZ domain-containing protein 3-like isoform X3 [Nilaparvata lugens]
MDSNPLFKPDNACKTDQEFFKKRFKRLCDSDIQSDCEFIVGSNKFVIKGHKLIFSMASPVFYDMFYGKNGIDPKVIVKDLNVYGFKAMKEFIYTGGVDFKSYQNSTSNYVLCTYIAATKFKIVQLVSKCIKFMEDEINSDPPQVICYFNNSNYIWNDTADQLNKICRKAIETHTQKILSNNVFLSADPRTVDWILNLESLALKSELELFKLFETWALAKAKRENIAMDKMGIMFNDLQKHIRFLTMTAKEFAEAAKSPLLTEGEKLAIALNMAEFGATPYPGHLSANRVKRNFTRK